MVNIRSINLRSTSDKYKILVSIYKLERCKIYWLSFYDLLVKDRAPKVEIMHTKKHYIYKDLVSDVKQNMFHDVAREFREKRYQALLLFQNIKSSLDKAIYTH